MGFATIGDVARGDVEAAAKMLLPPERPKTDVTKLLAQGGKVVVVGGRPSNFAPEHLNDPRVVFWHSTDSKTHKEGRILPANTRAVLFTEFIDHTMDKGIRGQAKDRGIFAPPGVLKTGMVRVLLTDILTHVVVPVPDPKPLPVARPPEVQTPPVTVTWVPAAEPEESMKTKLHSPGRGELKAFVLRHANATERSIVQAERLMPTLEAEGLKSTVISVDQAIRTYVTGPTATRRMVQAGKDVRAAIAAAGVPDAVVDVPALAPPDDVTQQLAAALRTADDLKASAELLHEALIKIQRDVLRLQQAKQAARQAMQEYLS